MLITIDHDDGQMIPILTCLDTINPDIILVAIG